MVNYYHLLRAKLPPELLPALDKLLQESYHIGYIEGQDGEEHNFEIVKVFKEDKNI